MQQIILDTSFLLSSLKFKIDIIEELNRILDFNFKIAVLDKTLDELKNKENEKLALKFIEKNSIYIIKTNSDKNVDDLLLKFNESIVATQDKMLRERLKKVKIPIITIRNKKIFITENVL